MRENYRRWSDFDEPPTIKNDVVAWAEEIEDVGKSEQ